MVSRKETVTWLAGHELETLRVENQLMTRQLQELFETATANDAHFRIMADLSLNLIECNSLTQIDSFIENDLLTGSEAEHAQLFVTSQLALSGIEHCGHLNSFDGLNAQQQSALSRTTKAYCELCRQEEYRALFDVEIEAPGSIAVLPINFDQYLGTLALGSSDPDVFPGSGGTLFLDYMSDVFGRILQRAR